MRKILFLLLAVSTTVVAQISEQQMRQVYEAARTPYKYGMVVAPTTNKMKFDCPTVFRVKGQWYMTYVCYNGKSGNDGRGYETWLAKSSDLRHWTTLGRVLSFAEGKAWDENQRGGFPALIDYRWGGSYELQPYKGQYWMTYIGGPGKGYEAVEAPLSIGMASARADGNFEESLPWQCATTPLISYADKNAQWWERMTQYKSTIYRFDKHIFGVPFVMFYNAGGKDKTHPKGERIGIALSKDMKKWKRYEGNPVFAHDTDGTITGDAQIVEITLAGGEHLYVMFYFSAFNPTREYYAYNTFAVSTDLVHWQDWTGPDLIVPSEPYDEMFAHKSYVVNWNDTVYHFYCAVNNQGQRGIALATNRFIGKSEVHFPTPDATGHRQELSLDNDWEITFNGETFHRDMPFNLDDYYGTQQGEHGNLHGEALFTKQFTVDVKAGKQYFLRFEGVGTYADITLNGQHVGRFDIGRTTETIPVTNYLQPNGATNRLEVRVEHPAGITDMPWVCGGCSTEWGFSEGSQPFGIFRPVTLETTDEIRIEPFGVHVWSNIACDSLFIETEIKNYSNQAATFQLVNKLSEKTGKQAARLTNDIVLKSGETTTVKQKAAVADVKRWSQEKPYLYTLSTMIKRNGKATESVETPFGFRSLSWPLARNDGDKRFFLNGKPVFLNGVCEYEHLFGQSHAFSKQQIEARAKLVTEAGFNAFRDAHQPHNVYYQSLWDKKGILWWPQYSAHIWYDTPQFRESFKRHLVKWVKERRNSPSLMLWGLQNESTLPKDFAEECCTIIRDLDPTCGTQRLITTCNGGEGTDWNVVQNWSGTYGGNVEEYGNELKRPNQLLNGEYGAWRTLGNHSGEGYTEEAFTGLLEKKISLAESVRDSVCGQFQWLLVSHDNPGRRQPDEALRRIDKVGPYNYKGLFSPWEQPTDAWYMYQRHYNPQPVSPRTSLIDERILKSTDSLTVLYRLNCGGDAYTDAYGQTWMQDNTQWSRSWGARFDKPYQTSQTVNDSLSCPLFQTARFGRHELSFHFPAPAGNYRVELFFVEPWYRMADAEGLRVFDVAINGTTYLHNLDIWAQAHYGTAYKRTVDILNEGNEIVIDFPTVKAGQAIISAIAIKAFNPSIHPTAARNEEPADMWKAFNSDILVKTPDSLLPARIISSLEVKGKTTLNKLQPAKSKITWDYQVGVAKVYALRWKYYNPEQARRLHVRITDQNGVVFKDDDITFLQTQVKKTKRKMTSITTGTMINAGKYHVELTGEGLDKMLFDKLTVE